MPVSPIRDDVCRESCVRRLVSENRTRRSRRWSHLYSARLRRKRLRHAARLMSRPLAQAFLGRLLFAVLDTQRLRLLFFLTSFLTSFLLRFLFLSPLPSIATCFPHNFGNTTLLPRLNHFTDNRNRFFRQQELGVRQGQLRRQNARPTPVYAADVELPYAVQPRQQLRRGWGTRQRRRRKRGGGGGARPAAATVDHYSPSHPRNHRIAGRDRKRRRGYGAQGDTRPVDATGGSEDGGGAR